MFLDKELSSVVLLAVVDFLNLADGLRLNELLLFYSNAKQRIRTV